MEFNWHRRRQQKNTRRASAAERMREIAIAWHECANKVILAERRESTAKKERKREASTTMLCHSHSSTFKLVSANNCQHEQGCFWLRLSSVRSATAKLSTSKHTHFQQCCLKAQSKTDGESDSKSITSYFFDVFPLPFVVHIRAARNTNCIDLERAHQHIYSMLNHAQPNQTLHTSQVENLERKREIWKKTLPSFHSITNPFESFYAHICCHTESIIFIGSYCAGWLLLLLMF